jgi:hypothetical protein
MEELQALSAGGDFEGAETLLTQNLGRSARLDPFLHMQFGLLYSRWNKLTSAVNHLRRAADLAFEAGDELLNLQILQELKMVRVAQAEQQP